jgi:hypothetical protein
MITVDVMLKLFPVFGLIVAIVAYLQRIDRKLDDLIALNWRTLDAISMALGRPEFGNAFEARSGRVIRRK